MAKQKKKITPLISARRLLLVERDRYRRGLSTLGRVRWMEGLIEAMEGGSKVSKTVQQLKV